MKVPLIAWILLPIRINQRKQVRKWELLTKLGRFLRWCPKRANCMDFVYYLLHKNVLANFPLDLNQSRLLRLYDPKLSTQMT